jgi:hypothetical protein
MPSQLPKLTPRENDYILELASQLRRACMTGANIRCGKADLNMTTGLASFTCRLPIEAFRPLYYLAKEAHELRPSRR